MGISSRVCCSTCSTPWKPTTWRPLATTLKYLHVNKSYEYLEKDKMLANEKANEKVVALDEYRKAS